MIYIGIDPGYAIVGYGVINYENNKTKMLDFGSINTRADMPFARRLLQIDAELTGLLNKFNPDGAAIERLFFNTNTKTAIDVAQGRGAIILTAAKFGIEIFEYTPLQVKTAVTGYGQADKSQIQVMVKTLLNLRSAPKPDDAADALAVAICHAHTYGIRRFDALAGEANNRG